MNIFNILKKNTLKFPEKNALIIDEVIYSYDQFYKLVVQTIQNLKKNNFKQKSVVIIVEDNTLPHILSLFALSYLNATVVPTSTYYSYDHLLDIIKISKANSIIGGHKYCSFFKKNSLIRNFLCTDKFVKFPFFFQKQFFYSLPKCTGNKNKDFIITMSSGSTAKPKPIVYSQNTKIIRSKLFKNLYKVNQNDSIIVTSPIDHSLGMRTLYVPFLIGGTCVVMNKFTVNMYFNLIKKYNVTFSVLVANQIQELTKDKNFKNFYLKKGLVSASAKLFDSVKKKIIKKKINLYEMYGAAEIGTVTSINLSKNKKKIKSVGNSYHNKIQIKIISNKNKPLPMNKIGEIVCKTPGIFKNYLSSKTLNSSAFIKGFFKTGDVGYLDKDKYLYFLSRKKYIFRRSGITIYPEDIEKIFLEDKKVKEIAVVGKETKLRSNLYIFMKKNKGLDESYVKKICLKKLSTFQLPNEIIFLDNLPKTNLGKINKIKLLSFIR